MKEQNTNNPEFFLDLENMTFEKLNEAFEKLEKIELSVLKTLIDPMLTSKSGILFLISSIFDKARLELIEREAKEENSEKKSQESKESISEENVDLSSIDSIIDFAKKTNIEEFGQFLINSERALIDTGILTSDNIERLINAIREDNEAPEEKISSLDKKKLDEALEYLRASLTNTVEKGIELTLSAYQNKVKNYSFDDETESLEEILKGLSVLLAAMCTSLKDINQAKSVEELNDIFKSLENLVD